jgi:hopanoid biosynthesis associated protein HpnK
MKKLIVNADDFGFTRSVNTGIVKAHQSGIVTSTTIMAGGAAFEHGAELAAANPVLGVGVHLVAVGGMPVASPDSIRTLVDDEGRLPATFSQLAIKCARGAVSVEDLRREFSAQIARVKSAGITPTHLDSHKHSHTQPLVMEAMARVAKEFNIRWVRHPFEAVSAGAIAGPAATQRRAVYLKQRLLGAVVHARAGRFRRLARRYGLSTPDRFYGVALTGLLDTTALRGIIEALDEGVSELMCHPALYDEELQQANTRLKTERSRELEALTDELVLQDLKRHNVALISYRELD